MIPLLAVSPDRFRARPQRGVPCPMPWESLVAYLSRVTWGDAKDMVGGYALGRYADNVRRKANLVSTSALVVDVDELGDVASAAQAVGRYRAIVHETFSSTPQGPRCRLVLALAEPIAASVYERVHAVVRTHLRAAGLVPDEGAKDASRLSYAPVRRPGTGYAFATTDGAPLDVRAVLARQPPEPTRPACRLVAPQHADAYARGALHRAADAVASSSPGSRHHALAREAFGLARLGLDESMIADALLPAFVASAGERREREGVRTITDAVRARRGAA